MSKTPTLLCIMDGWGEREEAAHNAVAAASTPNYDALRAEGAFGLIQASEEYVGLPPKQMGNSEVGHMNIGAGRPPRQLFPRINEAIASGDLQKNEALQAFMKQLQASGGVCHLIGLCSDGGVHAHLDHVIALAKILDAEGIVVKLHAVLDGRDTAPNSALEKGYLAELLELCSEYDNLSLATMGGRYFMMDRDQNWDRVQRAYDALMDGAKGEDVRMMQDPLAALETAYVDDPRGDEFVPPMVQEGYTGMAAEDGVLMANFRPDRARQIMTALTMESFDGFARRIPVVAALGMADYWAEDCPLDIPAIFPMERLDDTLGAVLAKANKTQLRIAETEKYNHVTFFFSGGNATFEGEERILIPSPSVETYDMQPEMSAPEVTDALVEAITSRHYDFMVVNYANPDMVGHSGVFDAAVKAVEAVDACLGRLKEAIDQVGGTILITADHGNVEAMQDKAGNPHTQHTTNPVPFIAYGTGAAGAMIREGGKLADIAPTVLYVMGMEAPAAMTGSSLVVDDTQAAQRA